jgi:hypothetical protein
MKRDLKFLAVVWRSGVCVWGVKGSYLVRGRGTDFAVSNLQI